MRPEDEALLEWARREWERRHAEADRLRRTERELARSARWATAVFFAAAAVALAAALIRALIR
jgi:hypothetical protein